MKLLITIALGALAGASFAQQPLPDKTTDSFSRNDLLFDALTKVVPHSLTAVRNAAESYRGLPVEMDLQFHETRKSTNPFFTRFTTESYLCFAAWGAEQALWHREEYENDFAFFFVDRYSQCFRTILEAKPYQRIRVSAVVRDVFRGRPYIEVTKLKITDDSVSEATIFHGAKAQKAMAAGETGAALASYEEALRAKLPSDARARMLADMANVHLVRNDKVNALAALADAKRLVPGDKRYEQAFNEVETAPAKPITDLAKIEISKVKSADAPASRPSGDAPADASAKTGGGK